ncbi:MAG: signal peptidase I [bacterium]|nr:signal peptidase I [bacterium]
MDEFAAMGAGIMVFYLAIIIFMLISMWKVFEKAGQPGWAVIIPIYNIIVLLKIAKKELWWIILLFIPFVNIIILILVYIAVAENFGKSQLFGLGLAFFGIIFFPILAFGDAKYVG